MDKQQWDNLIDRLDVLLSELNSAASESVIASKDCGEAVKSWILNNMIQAQMGLSEVREICRIERDNLENKP